MDDVAATDILSGQKILECTSPYGCHKPIFAKYGDGLLGILSGLSAGRQEMIVKDTRELTTPLVASQPFHQALEQLGTSHDSSSPLESVNGFRARRTIPNTWSHIHWTRISSRAVNSVFH
jgi:hypothetical protein